jgi:prolyl-tRNA synthetase
VISDFVCGANLEGQHMRGVNWDRDLPTPTSVDLRNVVNGDPSPDGMSELDIKRGIEVGHIFQLGTKYSEAMKASVLDERGKAVTMTMGCYGIGVSRIVAAAIEQNHDERGIVWPPSIAPFHIAITPVNAHKSMRVKEAADALYERFITAGIDVILCDTKDRPGVMFANMELIGIPHRLVLSDRGLDAGTLEYKGRTDDQSEDIPVEDVMGFVQGKLTSSVI